MSKYTDQIEGAEPEGGAPLFKFEKPGDLIIGEFRGRRTVKTKASKDGVPGRALDVTIIESKVDGRPGPTGPATVFESGHVTQLLDGAGMNPGDAFALRYHSQDRVSRFKKFAFKKYSEAETAELLGEPPEPDFGDEPPKGWRG
jgi:hypothetical protein